jgi:hypothetical protein
MTEWLTFGVAIVAFAIIQWTALFFLPLNLTYYVEGQARRRRIRLGELVRHMAHGRVELHGSLMYAETGAEKGTVGAHWAVMAIAILLIGPWVVTTK